MKAKLRATLQGAMEEWVENQCEHDERPNGYIYEQLSEDMTRAAEAVYDASFAAQEFAKKV